MRCLVLAHPDDETALRVTAALRRRLGKDEARLVPAEALAYAPAWRHMLTYQAADMPHAARVESLVRLAGGELLPDQAAVVFNRLRFAPVPQFEHAAPADRDYAALEMYALLLSWLAGLEAAGVRVINPASPRGLGAQARSRFEWLSLAQQAGLPSADYPQRHVPAQTSQAGAPAGMPQPGGRVLAAGMHLEIDPPELTSIPGLEQNIHHMQRLCGCPLLELRFIIQSGSWRFWEAEPFPHSSAPREIDRICDLLLDGLQPAEPPG
jgi:hypothetical protein